MMQKAHHSPRYDHASPEDSNSHSYVCQSSTAALATFSEQLTNQSQDARILDQSHGQIFFRAFMLEEVQRLRDTLRSEISAAKDDCLLQVQLTRKECFTEIESVKRNGSTQGDIEFGQNVINKQDHRIMFQNDVSAVDLVAQETKRNLQRHVSEVELQLRDIKEDVQALQMEPLAVQVQKMQLRIDELTDQVAAHQTSAASPVPGPMPTPEPHVVQEQHDELEEPSCQVDEGGEHLTRRALNESVEVQSSGMDRHPEEEQPVDSTCHEVCASLDVQLEHTYSLEESIWDAGLFIGVSSLGVQSSIYLGIAMMINVVVQAVFCAVCWLAFRQPQIQDESELLMKMWRLNAGHDVATVQAMWPFSLATRVCNGDESLLSSAEQKSYVDAISLYRPEGASVVGELMCLLCLVCFWNILWSDCKQTFRFGASLHFKLGQHTRMSLVDDQIRFQSVSGGRIVLCWTTVFLKLAVFVSLGMIGTIWLAHTVSVVDLLLNAAALELILSVDELIYAGLAPSLVKEHVLKCAPFRTWSFKRKVGVDVEAMVGMLVFLVLLPVVYFWKVQQTSTSLNKVADALCGGTQNFVYGVDALGMIHIHDAMAEPPRIPFTSIDTETDLRALALSEVISGKSREEWQYARWAPSIEELKQKVSADLDITMVLTSQCIDVLTSVNCQFFDACTQYRKALQALTGDTSLEWCSDINVELHCYGHSALALMSKAVCPVTCGCTSVTGGIYVVGAGSDVHCPMTCQPLLENSFANLKDVCIEDEEVTSRMWELWMEEAATFLPDYIRKPLKEQGCIALAMASDDDRAELCNGDHGKASALKPLLGVCPRACGCIPHAYDDVCTWRGHTLEACSCYDWQYSVKAACQNDACKNHAVFTNRLTIDFWVYSLEEVNQICGCPSHLLEDLTELVWHSSTAACPIFKECPWVPYLWSGPINYLLENCNSSDLPT